MWKFFKLWSLEEFNEKQAQFISHFDSHADSCPNLHQFVTDAIIEEIIRSIYQVDDQLQQVQCLNY